MSDEEKPKKKWTWWGEKKPKPKSPLEFRQEALRDQLNRDQEVLAQQLRAARQMRPDTPQWSSTEWSTREQKQLDDLLSNMTSKRRTIAEHNPMDAMCLLNRGRQSASSARCPQCRPSRL